MNDTPQPWMPGDDPSPDARRHAPATLRNRDAIIAVLRDILPGSGTVLEIASGSGEHVTAFAETFSGLTFQPSDPDPAALRSIAAYRADMRLPNLEEPVALDASTAGWPIDRADVILAINMVHISPWSATIGLLDGAAQLLSKGAPLYLYGCYTRDGIETAPSNIAFDESLRARNPQWGIRRLEDVVSAASTRGLHLAKVVEMPANNLSVVFVRS